MGNRFYWLKLKRDFFKRHDIQIIESMSNGKDYVLFYLKLLCESLDHEGSLRFSDTIPYNEEMLATITRTNIDTVRSAMKVFVSLGMIEILDDQTIYMSEVEKMIGSESESAERVRRHRALQAAGADEALHCNGAVTKCNTEKEIEKEEDIESETEKRKNGGQAASRSKFVKPTLEEIAAYCKERNNGIDPQQFWDFYESNGWKVGKNPMKDWRAAVRTWERREGKPAPKKSAPSKYDRRE